MLENVLLQCMNSQKANKFSRISISMALLGKLRLLVIIGHLNQSIVQVLYVYCTI